MRSALKSNPVVAPIDFPTAGPELPIRPKYILSTFMTAVLYFAMFTFRQLNFC